MKLREKRQKRRSKAAHSKLNLVALMDIFTILVFFLMVNGSEVQVLQSDKKVALPQSSASGHPQENLVLIISPTHLVLQGRSILPLNQISREKEIIEVLAQELNTQASRSSTKLHERQSKGLPITLFADQEVPYSLLKQILATCSKSDFRDVSLAIKHTTAKQGTEKQGGDNV